MTPNISGQTESVKQYTVTIRNEVTYPWMVVAGGVVGECSHTVQLHHHRSVT